MSALIAKTLAVGIETVPLSNTFREKQGQTWELQAWHTREQGLDHDILFWHFDSSRNKTNIIYERHVVVYNSVDNDETDLVTGFVVRIRG